MSSSAHEPVATSQRSEGTLSVWAWLALVLAVAGLAGSLYLSLGMNLKACPLCFYQRTFMMSLVALLGMGLILGAGRGTQLRLLGLPMGLAGLGVAIFHVYLEVTEKLECPAGVLGVGTAPQQSLAIFAVVTVVLFLGALRGSGTWRYAQIGSGLVLGGLLAFASCTSNPPMPSSPTKPYAEPPEVCRPPFKGT